MSAETVNFFFTLREQIKLYHWQTHLYSRHKATDMVIESLDKSIDQYVEIYIGKYGRPKVSKMTGTIRIQNLSETSIVRFIRNAIQYLTYELTDGLKPTDTDLHNLRDEMLGEMNQLLYLFTLR